MSELKAAVGYVRCSTDQQEDSPDQQKKAILEFAAARGYRITEWYVDFGKSGTTFEQRGEFQRLRTAVENRPSFVAVICYDESRWGRAIDAEENTFWRVFFRRHGVDVVLVKTSIDPDHEYAPMMKAFEGVQASQYSKKLSELTFRGASSNGRYSSGGTAPYGYCRVAMNIKSGVCRILEDGDWCVKKQEKVFWMPGESTEIDTVRRIFSERCKGASYVMIAQILNEAGIPCPRRGRWRNHGNRWSIGTICTILENPAYYGARAYNRYSSSKIRAQQERWDPKIHRNYPHWKIEPSRWLLVEGAHEPLVAKEQWLQANGHKKPRPISVNPKGSVPYLLSGLIKCGRCGFAFQGQSTRRGTKHYYRYICGGYNSRRSCEWIAVSRDELEGFVIESVVQILSQNVLQEKVESELKRLLELAPGDVSSSVGNSVKRLKDVETRIKLITKAIEDGVPFAMVSTRVRELEEERAVAAQEHQHALDQADIQYSVKDVSSSIQDFSATFRESFERAALHEKRDLLRRTVGRIVVQGDQRLIECYVRKLPLAGGEAERLLGQFEETIMAPRVEVPVRNAYVPGTGLEPARPRGH